MPTSAHLQGAPSEAPPVDLVLHIGTGKTGTSSLQRWLSLNREQLAAAGWLYPQTPGRVRHVRIGLFAHPDEMLDQQQSWHRLGGGDPAEFRAALRTSLAAEITDSGLSRVLLSDEALYGMKRPSLLSLRGLASGLARTVRAVVYLRRQDDHLISRYQQVVKVGETRRLAARTRALDLSSTYDYRARLALWEDIVDHLEVRRFERAGFRNGSLYDDFVDAVGIDLDPARLQPVTPQNESLDAESVEFLRLLNIYRVEHTGARTGLVDNHRLVRRLAAAQRGPTLTLPREQLESFMAQWEESNRAVARDFFDDPGGQLFRQPRKSDGTTSDQRLDPARLDDLFAVTRLPEEYHAPVRHLAEREAATDPEPGR